MGAMQIEADTVTSFIIDRADVRGRLVRLGPAADTVLTRYDYPPAVANILGELLLVAAMLNENRAEEISRRIMSVTLAACQRAVQIAAPRRYCSSACQLVSGHR